MAESDPTGLDTLIRQRCSRPSFARMVSWEILKSSGDPPKKSKKSTQRVKKSTSSAEEQNESEEEKCMGKDLELEDSESDESEYFSAEENFPEKIENVDECADEDEDGSSSDVAISDKEGVHTAFQAVNICDSGGERKRRLSKKQKKKRRRQRKEGNERLFMCYAEYTAPFKFAESIDYSIDELREDLVSGTGNSPAHVPSLFELCTRSLWSNTKSKQLRYQLLPVPLKTAVSLHRQLQAFATFQLSCLYRSLAELESKDTQLLTQVAIRSVWSTDYAVRDPERGTRKCMTLFPFMQNRTESEITKVIPFTYACYGHADYAARVGSHDDPRTSMYATSLVASLLDLMVPNHIRPARKKKKPVPDSDWEDQAIVTCASIVLENLKKRYPSMMKLLGPKALPYLYWLRGHTKLALKELLQLSNRAREPVDKACYMLEVARLCQLQGQMESARRLFQQSHQLLADSPTCTNNLQIQEQVKEQLLVLCANSYDQGVLNEEKAMQSLAAWQYLTTVPCAHPGSYLAAAESVLCYHLSHLPGQTVEKKIEHVLELVQTCSGQCLIVPLHLSLLYAWLGDQFESAKAYKRLSASDDIPGTEFNPGNLLGVNFTPWQLLVDVVTTFRRTVRILPVVWRTQLGIFRVVTDLDVFEGDLRGQSLGLCLSPEGHLTGNLHLLLPPVRAVNLDLYTGKLILPPTPGQTHVQKATFNSRYTPSERHTEDTETLEYPNGSYALTALELYSDNKGRQIHLLTTGESGVLKIQKPVAYLQLTSPSGQRTKLSLKHALKTVQKQMLEKEIQNMYPCAEDIRHREAMRGLEYGYTHDLDLKGASDARNVGSLLMKNEQKKSKQPDGNTKHGSYRRRYYYKPPNPKTLLNQYRKMSFEVKDFVSYGHTVCLLGLVGTRPFIMFLDASSKEAFSSPAIDLSHPIGLGQPRTIMINALSRQGHTVPKADMLCFVISAEYHERPRFNGQGGRPLVNTIVDLQFLDCQCVLGSSVYSIENRENRGHTGDQQGLDVVPTLSEMRFGQSKTEVFVYDLDPDMLQVKTIADRLLLVRSDGLRVLHPETMTPEPLLRSPSSECQCALSDDSMALLINPIRVTLLAEKQVTSPTDSLTVLVPVAVNDFLLVLGVQERCSAAEPVVEIAFCVKMPGHATEACFIGQTVGYLVSTTFHHKESRSFYRETVCQLSPSGQLLSILPCLGPGPRDFCPVLLPPQPNQEGEGEGSNPGCATWHVYMRDGHEGIIAVRL